MIHHKIATAIAALLCALASVQSRNVSWTHGFKITFKEQLNQKFHASFTADDHHAFALLQCSDFSGRSLGHCNLKIVRHFFDDRNEVVNNCKIDPLTVGNEKRVREIRFLKTNKILITWDGKHSAHQGSKVGWQRSPQIISTDSCQQGEYLKIRKFGGDDDGDDPYITVALENYVDVIYNNNKRSKDCGESVCCRLTFDYHKAVTDHKPFPGSDISSPSKFAVINGVFWMEYDSTYKYVIVGRTDENDYDTGLVYSPVTGYTKLERYSDSFSYSDANGFATLCWRERNLSPSVLTIGLSCKWLDGSHEDETFVANRYWYKNVPKTINTPDGNILVVTYDVSKTLIEEIRSDSKCKQLAELEWRGLKEIESPLEVSLVNNGKLCVSAVDAHQKKDSYTETREYTFSTQCIELQRNNGDFSSECGKTQYEN